jgi:hypothetical protein
MLRVDHNAQVVRMPWTLSGMFTGRYAVQSGRRIFEVRWKRVDIEYLRLAQQREPVALVRWGKRVLWYFHDSFYWDDERLEAEDVKALVLQRERRLQQKLQRRSSLSRTRRSRRRLCTGRRGRTSSCR